MLRKVYVSPTANKAIKNRYGQKHGLHWTRLRAPFIAALCVNGDIVLKKKIRQIKIDDRLFNWRVTSFDEKNVLLRIWLDGFKRFPWIEAQFSYRDPWLNLSELVEESGGHYDASGDNLFEGVTPKKVRCVIEAVIKEKGVPKDINKPIVLKWCPKTFTASYESK